MCLDIPYDAIIECIWPAKWSMLLCTCSPATQSPSKQSRRPAWRAVAPPQPAQLFLSAKSMLGGSTAIEWDESDHEDWESESFESTLSSIAAFDMAGALERMASGDKFCTPEAADSTHRASPAGTTSLSPERLQPSQCSRSMLEDARLSFSEPRPPYTRSSELRSSMAPSFSHGAGSGSALHQMGNQVHCWGSQAIELGAPMCPVYLIEDMPLAYTQLRT